MEKECVGREKKGHQLHVKKKKYQKIMSERESERGWERKCVKESEREAREKGRVASSNYAECKTKTDK